MELIWGIAALIIYFSILGILAKDAMDQIHRRNNENKIIRQQRKKNRNYMKGHRWDL